MSHSRKRFRTTNRLKRPEEYKKVFASSSRSSDQFFLFLLTSNSLNRPRLGLAVPKKHIPSAVQRNRLKRMIRESFRLKQKTLGGNDIVVVVKNKLDIRKNIAARLNKHWEKIVK